MIKSRSGARGSSMVDAKETRTILKLFMSVKALVLLANLSCCRLQNKVTNFIHR